MEEMWKPICGYEDLYEISSFGRLKARQKSVVCGKNGGFTLLREKIIKILFCRHCGGYNRIQLSKNNKRKNFKIARLVAIHFLPNYDNLPIINHKDGNKRNDKLENLEWCTQKQNSRHASDIGILGKHLKVHIKSKLTYAEALDIKKNLIPNGRGKFNTSYFAKLYNISNSSVYRIYKGFTYKSTLPL